MTKKGNVVIKGLPEDIKKLALANQYKQGNHMDENMKLVSTVDDGGFRWDKTEEGFLFWTLCQAGKYDKARIAISLKGEQESVNPKSTEEVVCVNVSEEKWVNLKYEGFEHYQVSNKGSIRSIDRMIHDRMGRMYPKIGKLLKSRTNGIEPHLFVDVVSLSIPVKRTVMYIHRVVMEHFGKEPIVRKGKDQKYVEHIDDDYSNNHIDNLRWITWEQLYRKQIKNGRVERMDLYKHSPVWKKSHGLL